MTISLPAPLHAVTVLGDEGEAEKRLNAEIAELAQARRALASAMEQFQEHQAEFFREAEGQLVDLAVEIARKILVQEIEAGRYQSDPIVREALATVPGCKDVVVRLHPDDLARCGAAGQTDDGSDAPNMRFVGDPNVARAECVLETPHGVVASDIEGQLSEIGKALKDPTCDEDVQGGEIV